jgi:flagellar protein FliS
MNYSGITAESLAGAIESFPSRVIVALYDEAIASLEAAKTAIGQGDIEARFRATERTAEVVAALYASLDLVEGGRIAENLSVVYEIVLRNIAFINTRNDARVADQAIKLLKPLRESWATLDERITVEVAAAESRASMAQAQLMRAAG